MWRRLKNVVFNKILGLRDTPHRIAWGVFLGFVVAFTPTVGVQMILYVGVATLLRANKVAGVPIVWLTNPATVVPIYLLAWRIGAFVLGSDASPERGQEIIDRLVGAGEGFSWGRILEGHFWQELGLTMWELGAELWLGGTLIGIALGAIFYPLTLWGVRWYRGRET